MSEIWRGFFCCFYDFSVQYMEVDTKKALEDPMFAIWNLTLLLVEGPSVSNARNIRDALYTALLEKYEIGLDHFMKYFTMVTDSAAVMARVANASVSHDKHEPDETWMGCHAHFWITWWSIPLRSAGIAVFWVPSRMTWGLSKKLWRMRTSQSGTIYFRMGSLWNKSRKQGLVRITK